MSVVLDCKRKVSLNEGGGLRMFDESVDVGIRVMEDE